MKHILQKLNKVFESNVRLGIMSVLVVSDWVEFNRLKELLEASDGNLSSHLRTLEKHEYVEMKKEFVGRRPKTRYRVTEPGRKAFGDHLSALEELTKS